MADETFCFVLVEAGSASLLTPLLRQWIEHPPEWPWRILAATPARDVLVRQLSAHDLADHLISIDKQEDPASTLQQVRAGAVIVSAAIGYAAEPLARRYAVDNALPTATFIDTWYNFSNRLKQAHEPVTTCDILVIDDQAKKFAVEDGLPEGRLHITGHPGLEHAIRDLPAANTSDMVFLGSPVYERGIEDRVGYTQDDYWHILENCLSSMPNQDYRLWYAPHPDEIWRPEATLAQYRGIISTQSGIEQCGTVLGAFAAPMTEAWLCGRRVISVQPSVNRPDHCMLSINNLIPNCIDIAGLRHALTTTPGPVLVEQNQRRNALVGSTIRFHAYCSELWSRQHA